ncbi:hypothetical protein SUGI_0973830 [Cryptomeria japonica]|nr:hypothetical protein SUGI_0973830 [Cryptomeria japonica]
MAVPGPSLGLFPYCHWHQKKYLPYTVNECNNINDSLHHFVGCSTGKAAALIEAIQPKLKLILPDYIQDNQEDSISETIKNLCKEGKFQVALDIFYILKKRQDVSIDSEVYAVLLDGCYNMRSIRAVEESRRVHRHMVESGIEVDSSLSAKLVFMYANRGKLLDARQVFEKMPEREADHPVERSRVSQNHRICADCHTTIKFISKNTKDLLVYNLVC